MKDSDKEDNDSQYNQNRRQFAKVMGATAVGVAGASMMPSASAKTVISPDYVDTPELKGGASSSSGSGGKQVADVVVWKDGSGTIYAETEDSEIDSGSNASTVIQSAIDHAGGDGGMVYITAGDYTIESYLSLSAGNVALVGAGMNQTRLHAQNFGQTEAMIDGEGQGSTDFSSEASNVAIKNMELDGTGAWEGHSYAPEQKCIFHQGGSNWIVENVYAHDSKATAIGCDHIVNYWVMNCLVENAGSSGGTNGGNGIGTGVGRGEQRTPTFHIGNVVNNTERQGIILEGVQADFRSQDFVIANNTVDGAYDGIAIEQVQQFTCTGNIVRNTDTDGIAVREFKEASAHDGLVANNSVAGTGRDDIRIGDSNDGTLPKRILVANNSAQVEVASGVSAVVNSIGRESAGSGNSPTTSTWSSWAEGKIIENTDDGTLWMLSDGSWTQVS